MKEVNSTDPTSGADLACPAVDSVWNESESLQPGACGNPETGDQWLS